MVKLSSFYLQNIKGMFLNFEGNTLNRWSPDSRKSPLLICILCLSHRLKQMTPNMLMCELQLVNNESLFCVFARVNVHNYKVCSNNQGIVIKGTLDMFVQMCKSLDPSTFSWRTA